MLLTFNFLLLIILLIYIPFIKQLIVIIALKLIIIQLNLIRINIYLLILLFIYFLDYQVIYYKCFQFNQTLLIIILMYHKPKT